MVRSVSKSPDALRVELELVLFGRAGAEAPGVDDGQTRYSALALDQVQRNVPSDKRFDMRVMCLNHKKSGSGTFKPISSTHSRNLTTGAVTLRGIRDRDRAETELIALMTVAFSLHTSQKYMSDR